MANKKNTASAHPHSHQGGSSLPQDLTEKLCFDDTAKQLAELKKIIFNAPDLNPNEEKIQIIKELIATDQYQVHSHRLANKLIEYHQMIVEPEMA